MSATNTKTPETKSGFFFDEKEHAYFLDGKPMHGITSVLGVIGKPALIQWAANEAVKFIKDTFQYAVEDGKLNEEVFLNQLELARYAHRKKKEDAAEKGTDLHALVEEYVGYLIKEFDGWPSGLTVDDPDWKFNPILPFVRWSQENKIKFLASEQRLYSKAHWTAGTCDLVFEKDGKTYIGDIKTYKKIWDRVPFFQCAAYGMMWEEMHQSDIALREALKDRSYTTFSKGVAKPIDGYCVLRLSKDGTFEDLWSWDVEGDRAAFLNALGLYKALNAFKA